MTGLSGRVMRCHDVCCGRTSHKEIKSFFEGANVTVREELSKSFGVGGCGCGCEASVCDVIENERMLQRMWIDLTVCKRVKLKVNVFEKAREHSRVYNMDGARGRERMDELRDFGLHGDGL